jgi:RNA polymerase sigma-70 factor, ECF subfamily
MAMDTREQAFRAIHDAHFRLVWSSLRRLGAREADVLDLAQKVFLTAYLKLPEFEGRSSLSTWIFGICQRVASDYRKSARIRREVQLDSAELDDFSGAFQDLGAGLDAQQRARLAEAILARLPESQRMAFVLYELEDLPARDIAELLGTSVGTVRSRLRLARRAFAREVDRSNLGHVASSRRREADPPRLLSPRGPASSELRALLGAARDVGPPEGAQDQAWRELLQRWQLSAQTG